MTLKCFITADVTLHQLVRAVLARFLHCKVIILPFLYSIQGICPGGGHSNPLQYSCLEIPMDRAGWQATVPRVAKSWTRLKQLSMHACMFYWTVACQAPHLVRFSRQEYWSRLPFPSLGDIPDPGIKHASLALQVDSLPLSHL